MPQAITQCDLRREQGFDLFVLRNENVEISVIPELGAKVVSLRNVRSGREWLWSAPGRRPFRNRTGDRFEDSPLIGWDECLPTIFPCRFNGRQLPDHGEVWSAAWLVDKAAWGIGTLRTTVELPVTPLVFTRTLALQGNSVVVDYALTSRSSQPERYLWAMHPLLAIQGAVQLELPAAAGASVADQEWVLNLEFSESTPACAKRFVSAEACHDGTGATAGVIDNASGDKLMFEWDAAENDILGLWLTRGGWHGHHHLAIEPTNGATDSLAAAAEQNHCGTILPGTSKTWRVILRLEPSDSTYL